MIDNNTIAFEKKGLRQQDGTCVNGGDWRARRHTVIKPLMNAEHGAVEFALRSKNIGIRGINGSLKGACPLLARSGFLEGLVLQRFVVLNLIDLFGIRISKFFRDRKCDDNFVVSPRYVNVATKFNRVAGFG